jgi:L-histidine N-alpha-methyltransferase
LRARKKRNRITQGPAAERSTFAQQVRQGLLDPQQKQLPCQYFYDTVGSALYDAICQLPEYGLWRADCRLLERHAHELAHRFGDRLAVAELGSGTGRKTRLLLERLVARARVTYFPIDLSAPALVQCRRHLADLVGLHITPVQQTYLDGLRHIVRACRDRRLLVLFLGSTIGNLGREESQRFLAAVRRLLRPGDGFLLSADLVKPRAALVAAYDDPLGVTAAFNRNLLARINRELGANFPLGSFRHLVRYNESERRIEMYLQARRNLEVRVPAARLRVRFRRGETICTEHCHKYRTDELQAMGTQAGFAVAAQWLDGEWPFAQTLLIVP